MCPVIDQEFRHYNVKVAGDPQGDSLVDAQNSLWIIGQIHEKLMSIDLSFIIPKRHH